LSWSEAAAAVDGAASAAAMAAAAMNLENVCIAADFSRI
jgi:hypothetical protein